MRDNKESIVISDDYHDTNISVKVVKVIQSYAKIVVYMENLSLLVLPVLGQKIKLMMVKCLLRKDNLSHLSGVI
jgi:hypothetical protein